MKKLCGEQFVRFFSATVNFGITDTLQLRASYGSMNYI